VQFARPPPQVAAIALVDVRAASANLAVAGGTHGCVDIAGVSGVGIASVHVAGVGIASVHVAGVGQAAVLSRAVGYARIEVSRRSATPAARSGDSHPYERGKTPRERSDA